MDQMKFKGTYHWTNMNYSRIICCTCYFKNLSLHVHQLFGNTWITWDSIKPIITFEWTIMSLNEHWKIQNEVVWNQYGLHDH